MTKPTEVQVSVDDYGNSLFINLTDTESISLYENMKETARNLTVLDPKDTEHIVMTKLSA